MSGHGRMDRRGIWMSYFQGSVCMIRRCNGVLYEDGMGKLEGNGWPGRALRATWEQIVTKPGPPVLCPAIQSPGQSAWCPANSSRDTKYTAPCLGSGQSGDQQQQHAPIFNQSCKATIDWESHFIANCRNSVLIKGRNCASIRRCVSRYQDCIISLAYNRFANSKFP